MSGWLILHGLPLLVDAGIKSGVLLTAAGAACWLLRHASAAARHLVWRLALGGLLGLPLLAAALPGWQAHLWPSWLTAGSYSPARLAGPGAEAMAFYVAPGRERVSPRDPNGLDRTAAGELAATEPFRASAPGPLPAGLEPSSRLLARQRPLAPSRRGLSWPEGIFLVWLAGVGLALLPAGVGIARVWHLERRCRRVTEGRLAMLLASLAREMGLRRPVLLLQGAAEGPALPPMTWGTRRPVVLLPAGSERWPGERLRAVLLHELAHVQRRDGAMQLLAGAACALYWFQPLVWLAARQMRLESERACDDRVLLAGVPPPDYAAHLLAVVRLLQGRERSPQAALMMAGRSPIERRLRAILEPGHPRCTVPRWSASFAEAMAAGAVVTLATVRPAGPAAPRRPSLAPIDLQVGTQRHRRTVVATAVEIHPRARWTGYPPLPAPLVSITEARAIERGPEREAGRREAAGERFPHRGTVVPARLQRATAAAAPETPLGRGVGIQPAGAVRREDPPPGTPGATGSGAGRSPRRRESEPALSHTAAPMATPEPPDAAAPAAVSPPAEPGAAPPAAAVMTASFVAAADAGHRPPGAPPADEDLERGESAVSEADDDPCPRVRGLQDTAGIDRAERPPAEPPAAPFPGPGEPNGADAPAAPTLLLAVTAGDKAADAPQVAGGAADRAAFPPAAPLPPSATAPLAPAAAVDDAVPVIELLFWDPVEQRVVRAVLVWTDPPASPELARPGNGQPVTAVSGPEELQQELEFWGGLIRAWQQQLERRHAAPEPPERHEDVPACT